MRKPFYYNFPIAKQIIDSDIEDALNNWELSQGKLDGTSALTPADLAQIKEVLEDGDMPPLKYKVLHWDSWINNSQKEQLLATINSLLKEPLLVPLTQDRIPQASPSKAALGKDLYFDKRLSGDNTVSCASCHALEKGGTDQSQVADGIRGQKGPINTPTVFNSSLNFHQFWDGRAKDLHEQAGGPVTNPKEMGAQWPDVIAKLNKDTVFTKRFKAVYPEGYSNKNITEAIAEYEKTLVTPNSPYDRYLLGDKSALTASQIHGLELFKSNNCTTCHFGANLGGQSFEKMGRKADYFAKRGGNITEADLGRYNVTKLTRDKHKFKVPTLRNIVQTYPYFHDGSINNLVEAVQIMAEFQLGKKLPEKDAKDIASFLESTTGSLQ